MKSIPTQAAMDSEWCRHWLELMGCIKVGVPMRYHRKFWEYAWFCETMHRLGMDKPNLAGVGFGVGVDPVVQVLASWKHLVTATDVDPRDPGIKEFWVDTNQHCNGDVQKLNTAGLVSRDEFGAQVKFHYQNMNYEFYYGGMDYCWSLNSLDHLGSIEKAGLFIERSMDVLRPGGVAIHTTELNITGPTGKAGTYEEEATVFLLKHHLDAIVKKLTDAGHTVAPLDLQDDPKSTVDQFVDRPPYIPDNNNSPNYHLKMENNEWVITSVGLVITKK